MLYKTHAAGGFIAGVLVSGDIVSGIVAAVSALLPDIESPKSFVGRRLPIISHLSNSAFGHRQVVHSLFGSLVFFLIAVAVTKAVHVVPLNFAYSAFAGYISHLILDTFNPAGIPWLWPLKTRLRIPITEPGGVLERLVILPFAMVVSVLLIGKNLYPIILTGRSVLF